MKNSGNPFLSIWTQPSETLSQIVREKDKNAFYILISLYGIETLLNEFSIIKIGGHLGLAALLAIALIVGPVAGLFGNAIGAYLLLGIGKMFSGKAEAEDFRYALAWINLPSVLLIPLWLPTVIAFGGDAFGKLNYDLVLLDPVPRIIWGLFLILFGLVKITGGLWCFVLLYKSIRVLQNFSFGKTLVNLLVLTLIAILGICMMVWGAKGLYGS